LLKNLDVKVKAKEFEDFKHTYRDYLEAIARG
jgi:hypothetical protein